MRHAILTFLLLTIPGVTVNAQTEAVQIESNRIVGLLNFLETAARKRSTSPTYQEFIWKNWEEEAEFAQAVAVYDKLQLEENFQRRGVPDGRHPFRSTKDLLWIAAAHAEDLDDFSSRIIGMLDHQTHLKLIDCLRAASSIYTTFIWEEEQAAIAGMKGQLFEYREPVKTLFQRIDKFYGSNWNLAIPFKISLYPIPLRTGVTTAIPKGNALICGFLSKSDRSYEGLLGVIVHEMCHILFGEQPVKDQQQIDEWMLASPSPYAKLAYSYLDEGLATALGNGWAFTQLHGKYDTTQWYNDPYIEGYARALYPMVVDYMDAGKTMDRAFVDRAITIFGETFPNANNQTKSILAELQLFTNVEEQDKVSTISSSFQKSFGTRSMWISTPIKAEESQQTFSKRGVTKVFVVARESAETQRYLQEYYPDLPKRPVDLGITFVRDQATNSPVILIALRSFEDFEIAMELLNSMEEIDFGTTMTWE